MANSLPLDTFRKILGYNPYHFWGQENAITPTTSNCNSLVKRHSWQGADAAGRRDIREAIETAENRLFEYLGYRVGDHWVSKELQYPRPYDKRMQYTSAIDSQDRWLSLDIKEGYIQSVGVEALDLIGDGSNVTYSDQYGDGLNDTATITLDLTGLDPQPKTSEIALYFTPDDRLDGDPIGPDYEIRPIKATISGSTLTIKARSWLFALPIKYQGVNAPAIDPADTGNSFAGKIDIYRRYNDATGTLTTNSQAVLYWETSPPPWCNTSVSYDPSNSRDPAAVGSAIARVSLRDRRLGYLGPVLSVYDSTTGQFNAKHWTYRQPDRVLIRYKAGANRSEVKADLPGGSWDQIVTRLAMAELNRRVCACDFANKELHRWQFDLSRTGGSNDESYGAISPEQLNNPLGTRRGALYAWNQVKNLKLTKASLL